VVNSGSSDIELIDLRTEVVDLSIRTRLCQRFFLDIYRGAFPKLDQTETPDVWLPLLNEDRLPPFPLLHLIIAREKCTPDQLVGGMVIEYFRHSRAALATYLAVSPRAQHRGVGRRLLRKGLEVVSADNGGIPPIILAEVERPDAQPDDAARL
jgi:ribosomal protein S18 acetylase RimI-like enzyme